MQTHWQLTPEPILDPEFISQVQAYCPPGASGKYAAKLLWQRGMKTKEEVQCFLDSSNYQPQPPEAFGEEMQSAIARLLQARNQVETVTIWGDFDADGVTSTSVLWDGLGQFFPQHIQLDYVIPHREKDSHGLNRHGITQLVQQGTSLIITCDTGSTNIDEIEYANSLGIDVIVTDHHTLPTERPPVVAIINPRYLAQNHPLYHLSGVGVAYKLVEALYAALPDVPTRSLTELLDLVAIGLIADLVELRGDCRYLAKQGIEQLKTQLGLNSTRPGVAKLLELCKRTGDRPTDISFGLGPRINAVSRIYGDAHFCVELLTSRDRDRCTELAEQAELANSRRKETQNRTLTAVKKRLEQVDLSTTNVIVLADPQWSTGVLGLVAGQIAQEYGRPTVLLTEKSDGLVAGSARSTHGIDLYDLVYSQRHLLHRFGGHPFAAGLSLKQENLELFRDGINQELRRYLPDPEQLQPVVTVDLEVEVQELGQTLFRDLSMLEPCGMGNPVPRLLIRNCWFQNLQNRNIQDRKGQKLKYLKTSFLLCDRTCTQGFGGVWWGHSRDELNENQRYDVIVELDYNPYRKEYEVRLLDVRPTTIATSLQSTTPKLINWRDRATPIDPNVACIPLEHCPQSWDEMQVYFRRACTQKLPLALAYGPPNPGQTQQTWCQLVGIAKYLLRTQKEPTLSQLETKLDLDRALLFQGLYLLRKVGFTVVQERETVKVTALAWQSEASIQDAIERFEDAIAERNFRRQYFAAVDVEILQQHLQYQGR